jgi:DNA polymerase-3 subunit chi
VTEVLFYTEVDDRLRTACMLTSKAVARSMRVMLFTPDPSTTEHLTRLLWTLSATGFVPHCRSADRLAMVTPVIIDHLPEPLVHNEVLINLCDVTPPFFSRFRRLVEMVGPQENDRDAARMRYRFYRDRGYEIRTHQIAAPLS